jgi:hypothetical protein
MRNDVVALLEIDGIDLREVDEVFDLDAPVCSGARAASSSGSIITYRPGSTS